MESRFIKEYNSKGELIFIVDKKSAKGFRVEKKNCDDANVDIDIEKLISQKLDDNLIKKDLSKTFFNRLTSFNKIVNPRNMWQYLLASYIVLAVILIFTILLGEFHFSISTTSGINETNAIEGSIGLFVFLMGVFFIHEFSHVLVARSQGILIKKIGFRIRYFVFPIFFVRIFPTLNKEKKMNIAFVGLVSDLFLILLYNILPVLLVNFKNEK